MAVDWNVASVRARATGVWHRASTESGKTLCGLRLTTVSFDQSRSWPGNRQQRCGTCARKAVDVRRQA